MSGVLEGRRERRDLRSSLTGGGLSPPETEPAPQLGFDIEEASAVSPAAVPTLRFAVAITSSDERPIRSVALNTQLRIAAERRRYTGAEQERLRELFGDRYQWARSLGPLPWANLALNVPAFVGETRVDLPVPCTYDFEVAAAKYLAALEEGEVPVELLFSGSVFYTAGDGRLQTCRIAWDREASFRLPVSVWRQAVDHAFPATAWLRVRRDTFDRLHAERVRRGHMSWEETVNSLLDAASGTAATLASDVPSGAGQAGEAPDGAGTGREHH